jgi:hypothetical protein
VVRDETQVESIPSPLAACWQFIQQASSHGHVVTMQSIQILHDDSYDCPFHLQSLQAATLASLPTE